MYNNILVPISFDVERNTSIPLKLAKLLATPDAKVTLLHVVEQIPSYVLIYIPNDYLAEQRREMQVEIDALSATLENATGVVIEGHAGRTILDWTKKNKPDLIIMASHRPGMQDLLLGSTASQVVRHASCSVHVVR
ncbi:MAG: universal stress protein [Psychromonas sp.]